MCTVEQTFFGNFEMVTWRRRDMDHIRPNFVKEPAQVAEMPADTKSLAQLFGHQFLAIAGTGDFASGYPLYLRRVRVGDLPATDYGDFKHDEGFLYSS
jgi:hypothetical protein